MYQWCMCVFLKVGGEVEVRGQHHACSDVVLCLFFSDKFSPGRWKSPAVSH